MVDVRSSRWRQCIKKVNILRLQLNATGSALSAVTSRPDGIVVFWKVTKNARIFGLEKIFLVESTNKMDQSIDKSAPEAITEAVASLPPEQMFELMKKMKDCVVNNPQEARDMLLKNTQLAYALFQGLVVMK